MPLAIDTSTIDFNQSNTGFTSSYKPADPTQEPPDCTLPSLVTTNLSLPNQTLTTPDSGCKFSFQTIFPTPPVFVPKITPPVIPCPQGTTFSGSIGITGSGSAIGTGSAEIIGGPCNYVLGGLLDIFVPPIPCPNGTNFTNSVATIKTSGIASGGGSISVVGGPCDFAIIGNIDIFVPSPPSAPGLGAGSFQNCPGPDTVLQLFTTDGSGNPILNFPKPCSSCDTTLTSKPYVMVNPTFADITFKTATTATCCSVSNDSILDLCGGVLTLQDTSGNKAQYESSSTIITGTSATITIDSSATGGHNISFQQITVCVDGTSKTMYVLGSVPI